MNVRITPSTAADAYIVKNLYPLYLHDLSQFGGEMANEHGILEPDAASTLAEQGEMQSIWWNKPNVLFPFIIRDGGRIAGFAFVARPPHAPESTDHTLHEFFLLHAFRGVGVGDRAACEIFDRFPGRWHLEVLVKNLRARAFWRKVLSQYTGGQYEERSTRTDAGPRQVYRFENPPRASSPFPTSPPRLE